MKALRVTLVLAAAGAVVVMLSYVDAQANGHGAFSRGRSVRRARTVRRVYRAPATYRASPTYRQPAYRSQATRSYRPSTYAAPTPMRAAPSTTHRTTAHATGTAGQYVDASGNVWIERKSATAASRVAPRRAQIERVSYPTAPSYSAPTYAAPQATTAGRRVVDANGQVWIDRTPARKPTYAAAQPRFVETSAVPAPVVPRTTWVAPRAAPTNVYSNSGDLGAAPTGSIGPSTRTVRRTTYDPAPVRNAYVPPAPVYPYARAERVRETYVAPAPVRETYVAPTPVYRTSTPVYRAPTPSPRYIERRAAPIRYPYYPGDCVT